MGSRTPPHCHCGRKDWYPARPRPESHLSLVAQFTTDQAGTPKMWSDSWSARKAPTHCPLQAPRSGPVVPVKKSRCLEKRQSPDSLLQTALQKARDKLEGAKIPAAKKDPIRFGPVNSWKQHWRDTCDRYEKYTEAFHIPPGCAAVPDD